MVAGLMAHAADKSTIGLEPLWERGKRYKTNIETHLMLAFYIHPLPLVTLRFQERMGTESTSSHK